MLTMLTNQSLPPNSGNLLLSCAFTVQDLGGWDRLRLHAEERPPYYRHPCRGGLYDGFVPPAANQPIHPRE